MQNNARREELSSRTLKKIAEPKNFARLLPTKASGSPGKEGDLPALVNGVPEQGIPIEDEFKDF